MYNIIATFKNMTDLKRCMKDLRVHPNIKGHMLVIPKNSSQHVEKEISGVLIKKSREIAPTGLENVRMGVFTGFIVGGLSAFLAVYFNTNLLNVSTITALAALAIIFYGAASGALLGFLIHTIVTKHSWFKNKEEAVLILQKLDDDTKELVIKNLETNQASKVDVY